MLGVPDPYDGSFVLLRGEWRKLDGSRFDPPAPRVEGRSEPYGCETGCMQYCVYLIGQDGEEKELARDFCTDPMVERAVREGEERGLPVVLNEERF